MVIPIEGPAFATVNDVYGPATTFIELPAKSKRLVPTMLIPAEPLPLQPVMLTVRELGSVPDVTTRQPLLAPVTEIAESILELESEPRFVSEKVNV